MVFAIKRYYCFCKRCLKIVSLDLIFVAFYTILVGKPQGAIFGLIISETMRIGIMIM